MNGQALSKAFIPLPAGATAVYTSSGLAYYRHSDHLGSSRLATTPSRTLYSSTAYAPFGEPYAQAGTTDVSFTGQDAGTIPDTTNGIIPAMYDFLMRKQSPVQGRWLSPDPAGLTAVDPSNPQTWNRYAYVMNNPMALVDPLGLCVLGGALPCMATGHGTPRPNSPNSAGTEGDDTGGMTCIMDGVESPCSMVESALDNGNAAICPPGGGICSYGRNGGVYQYQNTGDDGMAWVRVDAIDVINSNNPCAGATFHPSDNVTVQSSAQGQLSVTVQLTDHWPDKAFSTDLPNGGTLTIPEDTSVTMTYSSSGLSVTASNPIYIYAGWGAGAYISSATFQDGRFTQVNGTRAVLGFQLGSTQTASSYLTNALNQNSSLVNTARGLNELLHLAQTATKLSRLVEGCQ